MRSSPLRLALQAAVMTALVGGTTAFVNLDKGLVVTIDGERQAVHSYAKNVGDVLEHQGIDVGGHDTVAPPPGTPISDGMRIAVRYGRLINYTVDGERRDAWVTAMNVREALEQLGMHDDNVFVSVSRSQPIGRAGISFDVRLPHHVTISVEGQETVIETTAPTVGEALKEAGIALGEKDLVVPALDTYPRDGEAVTVFRIAGKVDVRDEPIRYKTVHKEDDGLYVGLSKIGQRGKNGVARVTYEVVQNDEGAWVVKRKLTSVVVTKPTNKVILVGARPWPRTGAEHLNWEALAECESGGDPRAVNPNGHYGLYQFSLSTWYSVGGRGNPIDASPEEQTYRAQVLYVRAGAGQWTCGSHLFD